ITESAMRGEIDFAASLRQRVGLLAGLDVTALSQVYEQRLQLNPGAEVLMAGLAERRIKRALVSGGFTFFTSRLKQRLALDFTLANELAIEGERLTGEVQGDIIGAEAKACFLKRLCAELRIEPGQVIAVGDGANDLPMLEHAGLGVAYHAKPAVGARADVLIRYRGLDAVLDFLAL
ncbi:MAG: phosphoserine phosphatase SerB, partial [Gammaproteobacteria bacterium]|nr:phosphoserine phosphatase SerB [Gammaproteobacteria bacterium]